MLEELRLRIVLVDPPPGVTFRLQRGKSGLVAPAAVGTDAITFELSVRLGGSLPDGRPRFLGEFAQGPPQKRFVYVNSGTSAGQSDSCWTRRAKVHLSTITPAMVAEARTATGAHLRAKISGRAKDGGPACASVPLLEEGWSVVKPESG